MLILRRDVPPVDAAAVDAVCVPDTNIVAVCVSPDCSVVAVQHAHDVVCYSTATLMDQRKTEPLWTWQLQGGASVRQARHGRIEHMLIFHATNMIPTALAFSRSG